MGITSPMTIHQLPAPSRDWALFLDVDGTLLDIADRPDQVIVPDTLPRTLLAASSFLSGALAIVTGRSLEDVDRLMAPLHLPSAAEHGAILRFADGSVRRCGPEFGVPDALRDRLHAAVGDWPGAFVEDKAFNVTVHFRQAPLSRAEICALANTIAKEAGPDFEVLPGRMAYEIRHKRMHKGGATHTFMSHPPFASRVPVFVGDDTTDRDGFEAVRALGGIPLDVRYAFGGAPAAVRLWLQSFA